MQVRCIYAGLTALLVVSLQTSGTADAGSVPSRKPMTIRVQQCREGCLEKFAIKESLCHLRPECSTCWDECAKPPPPKLNKTIRETWALRTISMLQQDSLVLVDVAWAPLNTPNQCLVTWEVSGGGLMGNLLTETYNVQLSLWPDTKYRVQVTCKNKLSGSMSRSLPLNIDTSEAVATHLPPSSVKPILGSTEQPLPIHYEHSVEDQSSESINHHTNFIFNWHRGTAAEAAANDVHVDRIGHLNQSDLNILTIAAISDMQKPLLFGVITGTLLLAIILCLYVCVLRSQRVPSDKAALIEDDGCNQSNLSVDQPCGLAGGDPIAAGFYSRTVHVLTV